MTSPLADDAGIRRRRRTPGPRQAEVVLTFSRRTLVLLGGLAVVGAICVFCAGFGLGRISGHEKDSLSSSLLARKPVSNQTAPSRAGQSSPPTQVVVKEPSPAEPAPVEPEPPIDTELAAKPSSLSEKMDGRVEAEVVTKSEVVTPPKVRVIRRSPRSGFGIQLGAFEMLEDAEAFVERHAELLAPRKVFLLEVRIPNKGVWHRIRLGRFSSRRAAQAFLRKLPDKLGAGAIVVRYR